MNSPDAPLVREAVFQLMAEVREKGVSVFHSSHVLSEVDRTCDRVAVLRDGRLVTVLTVQEARRASAMERGNPRAPPRMELHNPGRLLTTIKKGP